MSVGRDRIFYRVLLPAAVIVTGIIVIAFSPPAFARGGGAANLLNSPGYQRAQKEARDNYLRRYYGQQQVQVVRKKHRFHPR